MDLDNVTPKDIFNAKRAHYENEHPNTTRDMEFIFEKVAKEHKPKTFTELEEKIAELLPESYESHLKDGLKKWAQKLVLDRNKLKEIFKYA